MPRAYIYPTLRAVRAVMALECTRLYTGEATVPGNVDLSSLQPGMILRPAGKDGKPDFTKYQVISEVSQRKGGSTIRMGQRMPKEEMPPEVVDVWKGELAIPPDEALKT